MTMHKNEKQGTVGIDDGGVGLKQKGKERKITKRLCDGEGVSGKAEDDNDKRRARNQRAVHNEMLMEDGACDVEKSCGKIDPEYNRGGGLKICLRHCYHHLSFALMPDAPVAPICHVAICSIIGPFTSPC
ncbi:hypothetical protein PV326_001108 [Microctonus aethiopoides]|nr:hypothetical protein PV326_001108 [Microctonus aethiopoides]